MKTPLEYLMNNMFIIIADQCNLVDHENCFELFSISIYFSIFT